METPKETPKEYFRALRIIHLAIIASSLLFGIIAFFLSYTGKSEPAFKSQGNLLFYLALIFAFAGITGSNIFYKSQLNLLHTKKQLSEKMEGYRSALIVRYALIEGPAFFAIVIYMLAGNPLCLCIAGFLILILAVLKPSAGKAVASLELSSDERRIVEKETE